jgi:hypothetical protein
MQPRPKILPHPLPLRPYSLLSQEQEAVTRRNILSRIARELTSVPVRRGPRSKLTDGDNAAPR